MLQKKVEENELILYVFGGQFKVFFLCKMDSPDNNSLINSKFRI